jgi:hypothetical protein
VTRASATPAGTLVLDSEGLAKAVLRAREVTQWLALARADDLRVITSPQFPRVIGAFGRLPGLSCCAGVGY